MKCWPVHYEATFFNESLLHLPSAGIVPSGMPLANIIVTAPMGKECREYCAQSMPTCVKVSEDMKAVTAGKMLYHFD